MCVHRSPHFRFATVGVAALVLVFGMGTGVYAYESPNVVDGHPLYFVKAGIEQVEERAMITPEMKARFHAKMMSRRLNEGEHFVHDRYQVEPLLDKAADELEMSVVEVVEKMSDEEMRSKFIEELSLRSVRYGELSARVEENEPEPCEGSFGGMTSLRSRAHQWGLSDQEIDRLFQEYGRVNLETDCH